MPGLLQPSTTDTCAAPEAPARPRGRRRRWLALLLFGIGALLIWEPGRVLVGANFHTLLPGQAYRGAQPSPAELERLVQRYGIKTVINLRGCCNPMPWYLEQCAAVQRLGINQEDVCLSSGRLPPVGEIRRLAEVIEQAEAPFFIHCWRGADRTGIASAMVLLLRTPLPFAEARQQLGLRYGHIALGRPWHLDEFLDMYGGWLEAEQRAHSPERFRHWLMHEYDGGPYSYRLDQWDRVSGPPRLGAPLVYQARVRNTSKQTWRLHPHSVGGMQLGFHLYDEDEKKVASGRFGLFEAELAPGQTVDLKLVVPAVRQPGRYRLVVDMSDKWYAWFYQFGAEPLEEELEIRE